MQSDNVIGRLVPSIIVRLTTAASHPVCREDVVDAGVGEYSEWFRNTRSRGRAPRISVAELEESVEECR